MIAALPNPWKTEEKTTPLIRIDPIANGPLLEIDRLSVEFKTRQGALRPVNDVSLRLKSGRVLAVLGESGSGKSMLLRTILGIQAPTAQVSGEVRMRGVNLLGLSPKEREQIRGSWLSMVFQNPMTALDPVFTVEEQIVETLRRHGPLSRSAARDRALELLQLVHIPSPEQRLKAYPFELSGGMRQRIVIAMSLACNPSLLLADEPTTALDVTVQARVLDLLRELQHELNMSMIIVTHDVGVAAAIADDVAVMYAGRIVETGPVRTILREPRHPYTRGLLQANVRPGQTERPEAIPGAPPNLARLPSGCSFAPRCSQASDACWSAMPELHSVGLAHQARCCQLSHLRDEPAATAAS
ncbi:MAG TPA: ABC transporter ATP-binding protein [Chloroflexota bacterium]|nr:ABC transporter ATP-binding protein [Chloroflexota bacterium]